jgi:hypothetical protein
MGINSILALIILKELNIMTKSRPLIITFLGDLSVLSALLSIIPIFTKKYGYFTSPLPYFPEIISIVLSILLLIASIGFLRLKKWGYWLLVSYNAFFFIIYIIWSIQNEKATLFTYLMTKVISLIFIIPTINYFYKNTSWGMGR